MHTGVSSWGVVWHGEFERYTRVLMEASLEFPIHFLKIYNKSDVFPSPISGIASETLCPDAVSPARRAVNHCEVS